jgi:tripartite-type tricarboxylate transporter receptor subunit TctC
MLTRLRNLIFLAAFASVQAFAQAYPDKPVRIIVPFQPGGSNDIVSRLLAQKLTAALGQSFVVENRPGASGNIGAAYVARSAPDGYTLLTSGAAPLGANSALYRELSYDPIRDFAPVILIANQPNVLVVSKSLPVKNVPELIALAQAQPGMLTFGSTGVGTTQHMAAELFMMLTKTKMLHVPYTGGGPMMVALVGGQINMSFETAPSALPYVKSNQIVPLAVTTTARATALPETPTFIETGVAGYEFRGWLGLSAPAGTPRPVIEKLNAAIQKIIDGDLRSRLTELGLDVAGGSPEQFGQFLAEDIARYKRIVKTVGIVIE